MLNQNKINNIAVIIPDAILQDCSREINILNVPEAVHIDINIPIIDNARTNNLAEKQENAIYCFIKSCEYLLFTAVLISIMFFSGYLFITFFKLVFNMNSDVFIYEIPVQLVIYFAIGFVIVLFVCCVVNIY